MTTRGLLLSLVSLALGEDYIPDCNYAATGAGLYYPIDACESDTNATSGSKYSFKYICNDNNTIEQYMYSTFNCQGTPNITTTNMTELDIAHYSCDYAFSCDYAIVCRFLECNTNSSDTECNLCSAESYSELLTENHDTHCRPHIKDQCLGSNTSFAYTATCEGGVLNEHYKSACDGGFELWLDSFGGENSTCKDEDSDDKYAYYTVDCDPFVAQPECNFVGTAAHFYPVGACESDINVTSGELYSFRYNCVGNKIEKEMYYTFGCEGDAAEIITNLTGEVENYQCRSSNGDCSYAMACSYLDCGDSDCSLCSDPDYDDMLQKNHTTQCRPYITGECYGDSTAGFGLLKKSMCSGGKLTEGFYGDSECMDFIFAEELGGQAMCGDNFDGTYTYYEVDCNPDLIEPECNYAATGTHNYPIGACETDVNGTTGEIVSFKYVCDGYDVQMEVYNTWDCYGLPNITINQSWLLLEDYRCGSKYGDCSYAVGCSFDDCGDAQCETCSGSDVETLIQTQDTHCFPYITNQCFGSLETAQKSTCVNGKYSELTEGLYFGSDCSDENLFLTDVFGGDDNMCIGDNYYQIDCEPDVIQPECNYVAADGHFYAINACDSSNYIENGVSYKSSFKYVCNADGDIEKYSYSTFDCEGEADDVTTPDIEHHQCEADRDCEYAIVCSYDDCNADEDDTRCSTCSAANYIDNNGDNHNSHCFPYITEGCYGIKDELLYSATCMNNILSESFYYDYPSLRECTNDTFSFGEQYGGIDSRCQSGTYYEVDCAPDVIEPECNYVATGGHFYAVNACDSYNNIDNGTTYKSSFKYVCTDDGYVEKYTYSTLNCEGDEDDISMPDDIDHFLCKGTRDCNYATVCSYADCSVNVNDTTCSICSGTNYIDYDGDDHTSHCFPYITEEGCYGTKNELLYSATCMNNVFTESVYWGECGVEESYQFGEEYGGINTTCAWDTYYTVECIIAPTSYPTESPTSFEETIVTEVTESIDDDSKANVVSICVAFIYANIILFVSF